MKGETVIVNGDPWTIVDVAPAPPLAEMVAAILEEAGMIAMVRGLDLASDAFSHLGSTNLTTTYVLVPEAQGAEALRLIEETVTDFEGEELDELLTRMAAGELSAEELAALGAGEFDDDDDEVEGLVDDVLGSSFAAGYGPEEDSDLDDLERDDGLKDS